ncbi:GNAT family N-acetyltransferase [Tellurirhabdus rosea]|uniref:GNAT family N-acetyltransferase n=1 Tax=Tellurirhabdus rosea TaxID=2674997 RepID=UPI0022525A79|nr:GNAT family N-acetyltransferase [Tellurirhabdus rosea]
MRITEINPADTWVIRHKVMWPDQPPAFVRIADDEAGTHYGLFLDEKLVSVVSCFQSGRQMQFRKFATLQEYQGRGFGTHLLTYVIDKARQNGVAQLWCHARRDKKEFYEKFGLAEPQEPNRFVRAGREYTRMEMSL